MNLKSTNPPFPDPERGRADKSRNDYFHTGNVNKISGSTLLAKTIQRRRINISIIAVVVLVVGLHSVFF